MDRVLETRQDRVTEIWLGSWEKRSPLLGPWPLAVEAKKSDQEAPYEESPMRFSDAGTAFWGSRAWTIIDQWRMATPSASCLSDILAGSWVGQALLRLSQESRQGANLEPQAYATALVLSQAYSGRECVCGNFAQLAQLSGA